MLLLDLEGNRRRAQRRLRQLRQGDEVPAGLDVANEWPRMDRGGLDLIRQWADDHPTARRCSSTCGSASGRRGRRTPIPTSGTTRRAKALRDLAHELGILIVLVHHNRKAADADFLNEISGSNGLAAAADTILVIRRDRAAADAVLHVTGRDVEEQELALSFDKDTGRWAILGDADEYRRPRPGATSSACSTCRGRRRRRRWPRSWASSTSW